MKKEEIIYEIRRLAAANEGKPPGRLTFETEVGVREHEWRGRHWARWSDAVREAGFQPNQKATAYGKAHLAEKLIGLIRKIEHFPTSSELRLEATRNPDFPSEMAFRRLGGKLALIDLAKTYADAHPEFSDVLAHCTDVHETLEPKNSTAKPPNAVSEGFVYLMKSGRFYKIGRSNAAGRREYELSIQMPEKAKNIHAIRTDDPIGIEAYWHKRFDAKRKNGEWFDLSVQELNAFKKRKFM